MEFLKTVLEEQEIRQDDEFAVRKPRWGSDPSLNVVGSARGRSNSVLPVWDITIDHPDYIKHYKGSNVPYPFHTTLPEVESFKALPDDLVICTFPKSGSTWLSAVVWMIQNNCNKNSLRDGVSLERKVPLLEFTTPGKSERARPVNFLQTYPARNRVYYTHLNYNALPQTIKTQGCKIIYLYRNPKDTARSMFHYFRSVKQMDFMGSMSDVVDSFVNDSVMFGPYFDQLGSYLEHKENPNMFITTFERLHKDFRSTVKNLAAFMGKKLDESQLCRIELECNFEQMKINPVTNRSLLERIGYYDFETSPFIRTGKVGTWKSELSVLDNEKMDKWITEHLAKKPLSDIVFEYD